MDSHDVRREPSNHSTGHPFRIVPKVAYRCPWYDGPPSRRLGAVENRIRHLHQRLVILHLQCATLTHAFVFLESGAERRVLLDLLDGGFPVLLPLARNMQDTLHEDINVD